MRERSPGDVVAAVLPAMALILFFYAAASHWIPLWLCGIAVGVVCSFYAAALLLSRSEIRLLRMMNSKLADQVFEEHSVE